MAALAAASLAAVAITWIGSSALGATGVPVWSVGFELDGNPTDDAGPGTDWNALYPSGPGGGLPYSFDTDDAPDTIFTTGGSKDEKDISDWRYRTGSPPDKDDITNAFATASTFDDGPASAGDDLIVSFGLDRVDTSGDANVGFWFLQSDLPDTLTGGTFGTNVHHQVGDVLVLSSFSNGGEVSNISVYEWVLPADEDPGLDNLAALYTDNAQARCGADDVADACGIVNDDELSGAAGPAWPYQNKDGDPEGTYQPSSFFEGAVNLTNLFAGTSQAGSTPCFSSFVAETRSSTSVTATLKDFTQDSFDLCSANVSIAPDATNGITENHTFTVTATQQVLGGPATPATNGHADVTLASSNPAATITVGGATTCHVVTSFAAHTPMSDNLADAPVNPGDPPAGTCKVVFSSDKPTTVTANSKVTLNIGSGSTVTAQTTTATDGVKIFVDGTLRWLKHDQDGALLGGATFDFCRTANWVSSGVGTGGSFVDLPDGPDPGTDPDPICVSVTDNSAPDADATAGVFRINGLLLGKYTIKETAAPPGYALDPDTEGPFLLSTTNTNGGTLTTSPIFVNVAKYRLIVLSCSMADEQLIRSEVDLDGSGATTGDRKFSADSLPGALAGVTNAEKILCESVRAGNDANFPNLSAGTQTPSVQLPDVP